LIWFQKESEKSVEMCVKVGDRGEKRCGAHAEKKQIYLACIRKHDESFPAPPDVYDEIEKKFFAPLPTLVTNKFS